MPNVSPVPASATSAASALHPCSATIADSEATVPTTPSPSAMMVSNPLRSAMWSACQGVPPFRFSASSGPLTSMATITANKRKVTPTEVLTTAIAIQPTCATVIVAAYVRHADLRPGSCAAARSHWITIATRITT
jgi:hypothetical protein